MSVQREQAISRAFVSLATSLVGEFDVVDLLTTLAVDCAQLLDVTAAGLLLVDSRGVLHVVAASSETTHSLQLFQLQRDQGPCLDCYRDGAPVTAPDVRVVNRRWPQFVAAATAAGISSVHALPMRVHDQVLGALGLFNTATGELTDENRDLGQALADVASIALTQRRTLDDREAVTAQLQAALTSRVVLEQAKGVLAQHGGLDMDQAFTHLRHYARRHNQNLSDTAQAIVSRSLNPQHLLERHPQPARATQYPRHQ